MIRRQFSIFPGIGPARERAIRAAGIADWQQFLATRSVPRLPERLYRSMLWQIGEWTAALEREDAGFFARTCPQSAHWALFEEFGGDTRYLDIETTGLSRGRDMVTVVGIHDGDQYEALVSGRGLTAEALANALGDCKLLVTYFGSAFDVPFLQAAFPSLCCEFPHFDLCFAGRRVGLRGGLKAIERELGIGRETSIADIDGFEAVRLWHAHERGHPTALQRLIEYNRADTENLVRIAPIVYQRLCGVG